MDNFIQVVQLLNRFKRAHIDVLGNADSDSRFTELYHLISEGKIKTDEEAAKHFYGSKATPSDEKYRAFKKKFKDRLLNSIYFIDLENPIFNDFQKAYYGALHEWGAINIMYRRNTRSVADAYAERLLSICMKYEFTDICIVILERLKSSHGTQTGDKKKYQHYKELFWHYKGVWDAEHQASEAFQEIRLEYVKSTAFRPETSLKAQQALAKLEELRLKYDSFTFYNFYYVVKEAVYSAKHDWKNVIIICDEALAYFKAKPFDMKFYIGIFLNQKVIALLMLMRFEECKVTLEEAISNQEEGNINWFKTMEKKMFLHFYTGDLKEGYDTYLYVREIKEYKNLKGHSAEIWRLFEAYLYLAASLGKLPKVDITDKKSFGSFRLNKFINEIPTFSKDKKGMNIPVLVIQIALLVREKKYDLLIDRIEAIEKYLVRHVPKSDTANYRTNQMIKALVEIPKGNFHRKNIERKTIKIIEEMKEVPYDLIETGYKVEVVPYEKVWDIIMSHFGDKPLFVLPKK